MNWRFQILWILTVSAIANAENWQLIGSDKDAMGEDMRTLEIAPGSMRSSKQGISVRERITQGSRSTVGYTCSEGNIRHGLISKEIATAICAAPVTDPTGSANLPRDWKTLHVNLVRKDEKMVTLFDANSVHKINDAITVSQKIVTTSYFTSFYDCKGYFKNGSLDWRLLDETDHISTVPAGFVSLERKTSQLVCGSILGGQ